MADQATYIDVTIPETGWDRVHLDPDIQDPRMLDALNGSAPAWLYDAVTTADDHRSDIRLHPAEFRRLNRANWAPLSPIQPSDPLLGCRLTVDPTIPRGILRITARPTDDPTDDLSAFQ